MLVIMARRGGQEDVDSVELTRSVEVQRQPHLVRTIYKVHNYTEIITSDNIREMYSRKLPGIIWTGCNGSVCESAQLVWLLSRELGNSYKSLNISIMISRLHPFNLKKNPKVIL